MFRDQTVCEYYGTERQLVYRIETGSQRLSPIHSSGRDIATRNRFSLKSFFREVFLPQGYPDSVTDDYLEYQCWDTIQAFCSALTGTLATEAVMKSVGVGDQTATALAATLTWLWKDGAGMVGRIAFAWAKGTYLDCDSKKWRLVADLLNDMAIFTDTLTPYFKPLFTYMVCFSSVCRSIVGVAGGATRAALTQHQARRNNLADVSAKDGSQETLVNLSALICSLILVPLISGKTAIIWTLFCIFTSLHVFSNYRAVRCLKMDTLNENRFRILMRNFFANGPMGLREVNRAEPLLDFGSIGGCRLDVGCRLLPHVAFDPKCDQEGKYQIGIDTTDWQTASNPRWSWWRRIIAGFGRRDVVVRVALRGEATSVDVLRGVYHAELIRTEFIRNGYARTFEQEAIESTRITVVRTFESFLAKLQQHGWITTYNLMHCDEWRYNFEKDLYSYKAM